MKPAVLGLRFTHNGYQFYQFRIDTKSHRGRWSLLSGGRFAQPMTVNADIKIKILKLENKNFSLYDKNKSYIVFLPSGDMTTFILLISDKSNDRVYRLAANHAGIIRMREINDHNQ